MNKKQQESREYYSKVVCLNNEAVRVGRPETTEEEPIWNDIIEKISPASGESVLDIGCGAGYIAKKWSKLATEKNIEVTLFDFPEVIKQINLPNINTIAGNFPTHLNQKFDCIILYSVIHCTDHPMEMIDSAVDMLSGTGRLLVGDIPNIDKKGRFLSTDFGRRFDANYKGVELDSIPIYKDHHEYRKAQPENSNIIDDEFVMEVISKCRSKGIHANVLEQPSNLPFHYTREDILISA